MSYNPVNIIGVLENIANWNVYGSPTSEGGIPMAVNAGIDLNNKVAKNSTDITSKLNSDVANSINELLSRLNANSSRWAAENAQNINTTASDFGSSQSIALNRTAAEFARAMTDEANSQAARSGANQAQELGEDLNLFSTLQSAYLNNQIATPAANEAASALNENATADVLRSQAEMFGGEGDFDKFREQVNANLQDKLSGKVSQSTRRQLSRNAIASGNTELGRGAVNDAYAGYLGLTSEQLKSQGQQEYQSLYSLYRQSVPIVSGAQLLPNYALSNTQANQQAYGVASQLTNLGGLSAQSMFGASGVSAQQLTTMGGISTTDLYGTNALSARSMYGSNSLSNDTFFQTTSAPTRQIMGLTTLSPAQAIDFEFRNAENSAADSTSKFNTQMDQNAFNNYNYGGGPGGGTRTGSLQGGSSTPFGYGSNQGFGPLF